MKLFGDLYHPDIGLLNVSAPFSIERTRKLLTGEMTPYEAALAATWLQLKYAIPMHFELPDDPQVLHFIDYLNTMKLTNGSRIKPIILKPGETFNCPF